MAQQFEIKDRMVGGEAPAYIVAEMSANHNQEYDRAVQIAEAAAEAGADAIKLQTYRPDTMTIDSDREPFQIKEGPWAGRTLYDLYEEAYTPWDWQPELQEIAHELGLDFFSSPFDASAVEFLEDLDVPVYKIASFENVDLPLIRRVAETGKPTIMSTGMATLGEIDEAVRAFRDAGGTELALLACTSSYPAPPEEMHLRRIPHLAETFNVVPGLSDHTLGTEVPVAGVALGARIVEKHLTLSREEEGPDSGFSLEPDEFSEMVRAVRKTEKAIGGVRYETTKKESESETFRRSLFVVEDVEEGEEFTEENVRSIRPGNGLAPKHLDSVLGSIAVDDLTRGTPLSWSVVR
ncbi:pseudaminic acid synthase [Salinibacter ruber]|jgi:pseudaminic acid synthase|uniref:pseudaminic acid synthase n=1 Tax=Salinibacter ruber TaxID=146919 RepID=UPI0021689558|nr:pseudaminic acid synthase [Salinibacter ruber]MCS3643320.1 pseudaminic acid synthase [Salinibacter ruber]